MKKLARSIILVVLLLGVLLFSDPTSGINLSPELQSLSFDKSQATGGEEVLLSLNITDDLDQVNYVYVELYWENSSGFNEYVNSYYPAFNTSTQYWESSIFVDQYWELGWYYIDYIYAEDADGNNLHAYNGTEFTSPKFEVFGTTPDSTPPVLDDLWFSQSSATANDEVVLYAKVTDDVSGVDYVYAEIYWYNATGDYGMYQLGRDLQVNGTDLYAFSFVVGQYWQTGLYYVNYISMSDMAGNYDSNYNSSQEIPPTNLDVQGTTPDSFPPQVHDVSFNQSSATPEQEVTVVANVSDDVSGVSYVYVYVYWYNDSAIYEWDHLSIFSLDLYNNGTADIFVGTFFVNQYWRSGTYFIGEVTTEDYAYNWASFTNGTDYHSGELEISGTTPDFDPPQFISIWTNTNSSPAGSYFDIFVNATDSPAGLQDAWVNFEYYNVNEDRWEDITGGWLYYNEDSQLLEGEIWTPDYQDIIGQQISSRFLEIWDRAGNSIYLDARMGDFSAISLKVTERQKTGFNLSIDPNEGVSSVGQTLHFSVFMESLFNYEVVGKLSVTVTGADTFDVFIGETFTFNPSASFARDFDLTLSVVGAYEIKASLNVEGDTYLVIANWKVNEGGGQINVSVDPNEGQSSVNETVSFEVEVESTFGHEMEDVNLVFEGTSPSGEEFREEVIVTLSPNSFLSEIFDATFTEVGEYKLRAVLIDDIGEEWIFEFFWSVVDGEGNAGQNDDLEEPQIELPGFELPFAVISLTTLSIIMTVRRRKLD